jgi:hypothetical protein
MPVPPEFKALGAAAAAEPGGSAVRGESQMDYLDLLRRHDHSTQWEYPPGFDYLAATGRFARFVEELCAKLGVALRSETGARIQDASFHSQVFLPLPGDQHALIRFSNFGDMAAISDDEPVAEPTMAAVVGLLAKHGYVYVPANVLAQPYTGSNPGVTGIDTWWIRYFDWVQVAAPPQELPRGVTRR